jgi:hypothetical protein
MAAIVTIWVLVRDTIKLIMILKIAQSVTHPTSCNQDDFICFKKNIYILSPHENII